MLDRSVKRKIVLDGSDRRKKNIAYQSNSLKALTHVAMWERKSVSEIFGNAGLHLQRVSSDGIFGLENRWSDDRGSSWLILSVRSLPELPST
jgi:hypothetical protein